MSQGQLYVVEHFLIPSFHRYAVDCIILTTGLQILSALTNYMWLLWLLVRPCLPVFTRDLSCPVESVGNYMCTCAVSLISMLPVQCPLLACYLCSVPY